MKRTYLILIFLIFGNCTNSSDEFNILIKDGRTDNLNESFFSSTDTLIFSMPSMEETIFVSKNPSHFLIDSLVYIPGQKAKHIISFDRDGNYIAHAGGEGRGPGEFMNIQHFVYNESGLYVYDNLLMRITVFDKNLNFLKTIPIEHRMNDFEVVNDKIIAFSHSAPTIFTAYDMEGNVLNEFLKPEDEQEAVFLGRFQDGGVHFNPDENLFYGIYPDQFKIYILDENLNLQRTIGSNNPSKYRPKVPDFPSSLDPYQFGSRHLEYWESFNHIMNVFTDDKTGNIIIPCYEQLSQSEWNFYLNVYQKDGTIITEGARIPGNKLPKVFNNGSLYLPYDDEKSENSVTILQYKMKF